MSVETPLAVRIGALDVCRAYYARREIQARAAGDFEAATQDNWWVSRLEYYIEQLCIEAWTNTLLYGSSDP